MEDPSLAFLAPRSGNNGGRQEGRGPFHPIRGFRHSPVETVVTIPAEKTHQETASEVSAVAAWLR